MSRASEVGIKGPAQAWVSFCISTFRRPELLEEQLRRLLKQTEGNFEVVISDNDPDQSARPVVESIADARLKYFPNSSNLGMIPSFNKSIERANTEFVVLVTDDDPVQDEFLHKILQLIIRHPGKSVYGGFGRKNRPEGFIEVVEPEFFASEILDPAKTSILLWSSCVLRRSDAMAANMIPDFGSPHLADHALIALTGRVNGGVIVNAMFSDVAMHDTNFSKFNFDYYVSGCKGFYNLMANTGIRSGEKSRNKKAAIRYLHKWFIDSFFNLKKYYGVNRNPEILKQINKCAGQILGLPYMKPVCPKYKAKSIILWIKLRLKIVKAA
jgi:glycosyltransferase involved in cell wall biosynthesis